MSGKPIARLGDQTDHGGVIISASSNISAENALVARVGDMVACPQCKGTFPIISGVEHCFGQGQLVAVVGSKTACGATIITGASSVIAGTLLVTNSYQSLNEESTKSINKSDSTGTNTETYSVSTQINNDITLVDNNQLHVESAKLTSPEKIIPCSTIELKVIKFNNSEVTLEEKNMVIWRYNIKYRNKEGSIVNTNIGEIRGDVIYDDKYGCEMPTLITKICNQKENTYYSIDYDICPYI